MSLLTSVLWIITHQKTMKHSLSFSSLQSQCLLLIVGVMPLLNALCQASFVSYTGLVPSPRLSSFSKSDVTIQDNDDPHGIFTFENSQAIVDEEDFSGSGTKVAVQIVRQSGLFGIVSVVVRTFGGGEVWTNYTDVNVRPSGRSTQVNVDYQRLNEEIVFEVCTVLYK